MSCDIEKNPGPTPSSSQNFSICNWNLKSITLHSYVKISLLKVYLSGQKLEIICSTQHSFNLERQGNELVQSDHPPQHKRGDVCIYFRNYLQLKILNIHYLRELHVGSQICKFVSLYRSLSQTSDGFEKFTDHFQLTLDTIAGSNSHLIVKI